MTRTVLRWGRSAYESEADLALEERAARALGLGWLAVPETWRPGAPEGPALSEIDALVVTSRVRVDREALSRFSGSLVLTTTSGWDHIDVEAAIERGVAVGRCPLARRDAVAEGTIAAITSLLRRQPALLRAAAEGRWARGALPEIDPLLVCDATVAIVGLGVIGRRVAELLGGMGAELLGVDPAGVPDGVAPVALERALAEADVVTLHCALTPQTRGLMSAARTAAMRPGAVLVNTARGALVEVDAAVAAVREGRLRGLALDVFPEEPWPGLREAAAIDGIWLTPHAAGYARGLGERVATEVAAALTAWVDGRAVPHPVLARG